jgi:hypothetical protein
MTVPLSALTTSIGLSLLSSTPFAYSVLAFDNYFTGNLTDLIAPMNYELDVPQFYASTNEFTVPANGSLASAIVPKNTANFSVRLRKLECCSFIQTQPWLLSGKPTRRLSTVSIVETSLSGVPKQRTRLIRLLL